MTDFESWLLMADVATLLKDDGLLRDAASHMIKAEPSRSEGYLTQAVSRRNMGNLEGALESVRLAMARAEDDETPARLETLILDEIAGKSAMDDESEQ